MPRVFFRGLGDFSSKVKFENRHEPVFCHNRGGTAAHDDFEPCLLIKNHERLKFFFFRGLSDFSSKVEFQIRHELGFGHVGRFIYGDVGSY